MRGRPSKLTPEVEKTICQAIALGNHLEDAARYAGIDYTTFWRWMVRGGKAKAGKYRNFHDEVKKAESQAKVRIVAHWQKRIPDSWQAAERFLARRWPEQWGNREKIEQEISGKKDGEPIKLDMAGLSDDIVEFIARLARGEERNAQDGDD